MNLDELLTLECEKRDKFLRTLSPEELNKLQSEVLKKIEKVKEEMGFVSHPVK